MQGLGTNDPFVEVVGAISFWIAALTGVVGAWTLVASVRNLVRGALALTATLSSVAVLYVLLAADFLAMIQLIVYVSAIMVLLIFAIFMTPGQEDEPGLVPRSQRWSAALVSALVLGVAVFVITQHPWNIRQAPLDMPTTESIGGLMLTTYLLPFQIAGVLLTVALVGAIVIARED